MWVFLLCLFKKWSVCDIDPLIFLSSVLSPLPSSPPPSSSQSSECACVHVCLPTVAHIPWYGYEGWRTTFRGQFSLSAMSSGSWTWVTRQDSMLFTLLKHLASSHRVFLGSSLVAQYFKVCLQYIGSCLVPFPHTEILICTSHFWTLILLISVCGLLSPHYCFSQYP